MSMYEELLLKTTEEADKYSAEFPYPMTTVDYKEHIIKGVLKKMCFEIENIRNLVHAMGGRQQ